MRILIVSNLYPPELQGGYEILCQQVVEWLEAAGHQICVLTSTGGPTTTPQVLRRLRLAAPFPGPPPRSRLQALRLQAHNQAISAEVIEEQRPEVIFLWSQLRLGSGPARAAEASGFPCLYTWNDDHILGLAPVPWGPGLRRFAGALSDRSWARPATWLGLRFSHAICISQRLAEVLSRGGYPGPMQVVYQGVRLEDFACKEDPGAPGRRLLYVGQLHEYKGVHTIIEALNLCPGWTLTVVGSGNPDYEQRLRQMGGPVEFLGRQPRSRLPEIYRSHHAFVFPSIWIEPYGLTHLEAMASGLPVLATLHGGHGEHLRHLENCLGFEKCQYRELAAQIQKLEEDPHLGRRLARAGRQLVESTLNFERYAREVEGVLERTLIP